MAKAAADPASLAAYDMKLAVTNGCPEVAFRSAAR